MKKIRNAAIPAIFMLSLLFVVVLVSGAISNGNTSTTSGSSHGSGCPNKP